MRYPVKRLFYIYEDVVKILVMFRVLLQDFEVKDLFCDAYSGYEPNLFCCNGLFSLGFKSVQDD